MRILVTCLPAISHFRVVSPVIRALVRMNMDVTVACSPRLRRQVEELGAEHLPCGLSYFPRAEYTGDDAYWRKQLTETILPALTEAMFHDLRHVLAEVEPDLLIRDFSERGSYLAAEDTGLAHWSVASGGPTALGVTSDLAWMERMRLRMGIGELSSSIGLSPNVHLCLHAPQFHGVAAAFPAAATFARHELDLDEAPDRGVVEAVRAQLAADTRGGPVVLVAMGTVVPVGETETFDEVVRQAVETGLRVVCLEPGPSTGRVQVRDGLIAVTNGPQQALLPLADVVVSHGGALTVLETLAAGVPSVNIPFYADGFYMADRADALGAGVRVERESIGSLPLSRVIRDVAADPGFSTAAGEFRRLNLQLPTIDQVLSRRLSTP